MSLDYIALLTPIIAILAMGYIQWKTGSRDGVKVASEVIETYKTQVQQLREELATEKETSINDRHDLKNQITDLRIQLANIQGANTEKDKKIKELTEMLQGRNPEDIQYREDMRKFTQGVAEYMDKTTSVLGEISIFMKGINTK